MNEIVHRALDGEVLSKADAVRVLAHLSPFEAGRVRKRYKAGLTVAEIVGDVARQSRSPADRFHVSIDGDVIPRAQWKHVRPRPRTTLHMRPVAAAPIAAIFAAIGSAFAGFQTFIAGLGFFGKILMAGASLLLKFALNALFAPPKPEIPKKPKEAYSFAGARNQMRPFETVPSPLGKHRVSPDFGALPFIEDRGNDQYIRIHCVVGDGPIDISDIRIGETPYTEYDNVQIQIREGYSSDTPQTLYPDQPLQEQMDVVLEGPPDSDPTDYQRETRYTASNITEISTNFFMPQGQIRYDSEGKKSTILLTIKQRYRPYPGGGSWTNRPDIVRLKKTVDPQRFGDRWDVSGSTQWEVEVWRVEVSDDNNSGTAQRYRQVKWVALTGFRPALPTRPDKPLATITMRMKATGQLNGMLDQVNCIVQRKCKHWNGSTWVNDTPTQWPMDLFRWVLQGASIAKPLLDSQIDLQALQDWGDYCMDEGFKYNKPVSEARSIPDVLAEIAAAGRATAVKRGGKWSVIWDEQDLDVAQMFTPRNSRDFQMRHNYIDLPHAFRVRFVNEAKRYVQDERIVYDDGYNQDGSGGKTAATRFEVVEFPGITTASLAYRHARFHIAQMRLRPAQYELVVPFEGLRVERGDLVRLQHDVMLVGTGAARVTSIFDDGSAVQVVYLDDAFLLDDQGYQMRARRSDGTYALRDIAPGQDGVRRDYFQLVGYDADEMPDEGDLIVIGVASQETGLYRVLEIKSEDDLCARLTLVDHAPEIADADNKNAVIPPFDSNVTPPVDMFAQPPKNLQTTQGNYQEGNRVFGFIEMNWLPPTYGEVDRYETQLNDDDEWRRGTNVLGSSQSARISNLGGDIYKVRVRAIFRSGEVSRWVESDTLNMNYLSTPPVVPATLRIDSLGANSTLTWSEVPGCNYDIRFVADGGTVSWNTGVPLLTNISGTTAQVPTMIGTYMLKSVTPAAAGGVRSLDFVSVYTTVLEILNLNVVQTLTQQPGWTGTKSNTTVASSTLRLSTMTGGVQHEGLYTFPAPFDLGSVFTCRVTSLIEAQGDDVTNTMDLWPDLASVGALDSSSQASWQVILEMRTAQDGVPTWSDWQPFLVGDVTARQFDFRLRLIGMREDEDQAYATVTPVVSRCEVTIDMPDRIEGAKDVLTTGGSTGVFNVTYPGGAFRVAPALNVTPQDMLSGERVAVTNKTVSGFSVRFFNSGGTGINRTFDWVAKGYGKVT